MAKIRWDDDTDDDEPPRRRRRSEDDYDDDEPPRRRRRSEDDYDDDEYDDDPRPRRRRRPDAEIDNAGLQYILPVNTSVLAIIAGYLGLISVLCVPAPFALITGILALMQLKRDPDLNGQGRAIFGIVMGALFSLPLPFLLYSLARK